MCGVTTGGSEDCFWECNIEQIGNTNIPFITPPECLLNCFPEVCNIYCTLMQKNHFHTIFQDNCFHHLIQDYLKTGICEGTPDPVYNPLNYPTSSCKTKFQNAITKIKEGVCSEETEKLLTLRNECAFVLQQQSTLIYNKLVFLMTSMCKTKVTDQLLQFLQINRVKSSPSARLVPLETVMELNDATLVTNLNLGKF